MAIASDSMTTICSHCERDIPTVNIQLHYAHCSRNLQKCSICGEIVPIKHADEHFKESHAPIDCSLCSETIEREGWSLHQDEKCPKRIVTCEFCEFPLPAADLFEHQEVCGNRTELCHTCNKYIRLRELIRHEVNCQSYSDGLAESSGSRLLSATSMNCRCRPSAVRRVLDKIRPSIDESTWNELESMNLAQFFELPPYPQDHVLTMHIINCWDIDRRAFKLGGREIQFDSDEVALLIGMPNRGVPACWSEAPPDSMDARQIKDALLNFSPGESSHNFLQLLIKFLMSNLLFPSNNFKVSNKMCSICDDVVTFTSYNWPVTVWRSITEQLNVSALKIRANEKLGYLTGFVFILTLWFYEHTSLVFPALPEARPRMLRWPAKVKWNTAKIQLAFQRLRPVDVYDCFLQLKDSEHRLFAHPLDESTSPEKTLLQKESQSIPHSPMFDAAAALVPYNVGPEPTRAETYSQSIPDIGLQEIHDLLKGHHKMFLDFQSSVFTRLANIENTVTELKCELIDLKKSIKKSGVGFGKKWSKEFPQGSLVPRMKARADRRKRPLSFPFMVFERQKKKKTTVEAAQVQALDIEKTVAVEPVKGIDVDDQHISKTARPAALILDLPDRQLIPEYMRETIYLCCSKFTDLSDLVIDTEKVSLTRSYLDELLINGWLGNEQVDCFVMLL